MPKTQNPPKSKYFYKVLTKSGQSTYQYSQWNLPKNGEPGEWMPPITGELVMCRNGYHLCDPWYITHWNDHSDQRVFKAEVKGPLKRSTLKVAVKQARLLHEINRLPLYIEIMEHMFLERYSKKLGVFEAYKKLEALKYPKTTPRSKELVCVGENYNEIQHLGYIWRAYRYRERYPKAGGSHAILYDLGCAISYLSTGMKKGDVKRIWKGVFDNANS
jgi:hypothetical protein